MLLVQRVIELEDGGVQRSRKRRREGIGQKVVAVSLRGPVGHRELLEERQGGSVRAGCGANSVPDARGVQNRYLCWSQGVGRSLRALGVIWVDTILIGEISLAKAGAWNHPSLLRIFRGTLSFVVEEKEELVFLDRAAEGSAECVADELTGPVRFTRLQLALFVEPIVSVSETVAVVFVGGAMKFVRPRLGHQGNLCS